MRDRLELFGPIRFLENHFCEKEDIIVKYKRLEDSIKAFEVLQVEFQVVYVPTKHNSDEANNFNINDQDSRDATITLNMLKIKNDPLENENKIWDNNDLSKLNMSDGYV